MHTRLKCGQLWTRAVAWAAALGLRWGAAANTSDVILRGERCWIVARGEPLTNVLAEFQRLGVAIKTEPGLDRTVNVDLRDQHVERALRAALGPLDFVVEWSVLQGPISNVVRVKEIRVFSPGQEQRVRPWIGRRYTVSRGADGRGPLHIEREVLVVMRRGVTGRDFLSFLEEWNGSVVDSIPSRGIYRLRLGPGQDALATATRMRQDPRVEVAEANMAIRVPVAMPTPGTGSAAAGAPPVSGVSQAAVAVLDTGLAVPAGWQPSVVGAWDATQPGAPVTDPIGHGTQMALVASGAIVPEHTPPAAATPVLAIRTFDDQGVTSNFDILRAIQYAADQGARVVSLSWGTDTPSYFLHEAVSEAQARGMVVVAAAGNEATGRPNYPAAYPGVVAVAGVRGDGQRWESSNYGDFVVLAAPAVAQFPVGYQGPPGRYAGTSTATAYTSAILGQWWLRNPTASAAEAVDALRQSLSDAGAPGRDPYYGYGVLDAAAVYRFLSSPRP